jgi:KaiC/GvpD/RAD55 family RecA-like ATPase
MYEFGDALSGAAVDPGRNVLISGPPMTGKQKLGFQVLAHGSARDEGAIVVTTKDSAERVRERYTDYVGVDGKTESETEPFGVVDCVSRQQGMSDTEGTETVRYASSPVDLTGIGIELSELLQGFYRDRGIEDNRVLLHSLSTLLMYSDLETVFRFLHVFTGRVQSVDGLGLYVVDDTAHDEQTMSTLKQLFDSAIEVRDAEGGPERRLVGFSSVDDSWQPL